MARRSSTALDRAQPRSIDELHTPFDVAARLKVADSTLAQWRFEGRGPAWVRVGRQVRYPESGIRAFIERNTTQGDGATDR